MLFGKAVGHAALWIGSEAVSEHNAYDTDNYVSWWPKGGTSGVGKNDIYGPAVLHSYADDLDPVKGEGHAPDIALPLPGWDVAKLRTYFRDTVLGHMKYWALGRNCVCVVVELLHHGYKDAGSHKGDQALVALRQLSRYTQFPNVVAAFAEGYRAHHSECELCRQEQDGSVHECRSLSASAPSSPVGSSDRLSIHTDLDVDATPSAPPNSPIASPKVTTAPPSPDSSGRL